MTDIAISTQPFQSEDLSWDLSSPQVPYVESGTLDVSLFNQAQHFPNGFIPSGTVLARKTSTTFLGPYLDSLSNGQEVALGILRTSIQVVQPTGALKTRIGVPVLRAFGVIRVSHLPFTSAATLGGFIDAAGQTDLKNLLFTSV